MLITASHNKISSNEICATSCICKGKGSLYAITERRVPELIPVLGSQHES